MIKVRIFLEKNSRACNTNFGALQQNVAFLKNIICFYVAHAFRQSVHQFIILNTYLRKKKLLPTLAYNQAIHMSIYK